MDINNNFETPMMLKVGFKKLLEHYENLAKNSEDEFLSLKAGRVLKTAEPFPELRAGFSDTQVLLDREKEIQIILQDSFAPILSQNEIKTASVPFHDLIFNASARFKNIIKTAGLDFELNIKNMPENDRYITACAIILNFCYGYNINFKRPFYYEIPDAKGILHYYKILYNADFCEITPTKKAKKITEEDYNELLDNFENIKIWKQKFPPNSYIFNGFVISNIFDVTDDQSISNIKSSLIAGSKLKNKRFMGEFREIFRSLLMLKDINVGFSLYNKDQDAFERVYENGMKSFLLGDKDNKKCTDALCRWSYNRLLNENKYFSVSNVDRMFEKAKERMPHVISLHEQGIKSAIFAPIANSKGLMGIIEIVSSKPGVLNSVNANKLVDVMPFIVSAVERSKKEEENLIEAVIQQECTSVHPSVKWRFTKEAKRFIRDKSKGSDPSFKKIAFNNVYPLYGQIDIKGSSEARNLATQQDLRLQLNAVKNILVLAIEVKKLPIYEQHIFQINNFLQGLNNNFQVDSEQQITGFLTDDIKPILQHINTTGKLNIAVNAYLQSIDDNLGMVYNHRKQYDKTVASINREMASVLDRKQVEAQAMYPHFFERFKTDGVEHNMYIGESITKNNSFNLVYLYNLRLWQLQIMCEMENSYYQMKSGYPIALDVASMILVFSQPLSISFRMDEKQFDVDGTYNARYEIVKKRVDKAFIKGTKNRLTQQGKISIVYSQKQDEIEYLNYIKFLQSKHYLDTDVEIVELQDLQAVTGLKAIRVSVLYHKDKNSGTCYTYNDLMATLKA